MKPLSTQQTSPSEASSKWLFRFSLLVVSATLFLILAGGLVTSHDAGLAVPDWPTSYGQWFPPMVGNVFWEHGHRMIAGTVGLLTLILAFWVQLREKRKKIKALAWLAFAMVVFQALLGGLTVILMLPDPVSIAHACLAQTFFCVLITLAYSLSTLPGLKNTLFTAEDAPGLPGVSGAVQALYGPVLAVGNGMFPYGNVPARGDRPRAGGRAERGPLTSEDGISRLRRLLVLTLVFIYLQLILGATIRHTPLTWPVVIHIVVAFLILIHVLLVVLRVLRLRDDFALRKWSPAVPYLSAESAEASNPPSPRLRRVRPPHSSPGKPGVFCVGGEKGWEGFESLFSHLRRSALSLGFITVCQIFLGFGAFIFTRMLAAGYAPSYGEVIFTAAHQTLGAVILGVAFLMSLMVWR